MAQDKVLRVGGNPNNPKDYEKCSGRTNCPRHVHIPKTESDVIKAKQGKDIRTVSIMASVGSVAAIGTAAAMAAPLWVPLGLVALFGMLTFASVSEINRVAREKKAGLNSRDFFPENDVNYDND